MREGSNCRCQKLKLFVLSVTQTRIKWLDMNSEAQQKNGPSSLRITYVFGPLE